MKTKTLSLVILLAVGALILTGCSNNEASENNTEYLQFNDAAQFCIDNGGKYDIVRSETAVYGECTLADGTVCEEWNYYDGRCPETANTEEKTLTLEELNDLMENNFPVSYEYSGFNNSTNQPEGKGEHTYNADEIGILTPEHTEFTNRKLINTWTKDGMLLAQVFSDTKNLGIANVVYTIDPINMNFISANITIGDITNTYNFSY